MELLWIVAAVMLLMLLAMLAVIGVMVGITGWKLDMRNRVDVSRPSAAPMSWLVAPTGAAGLHRGLRDTATMLRRLGPLDEQASRGTTDHLRAQLLCQAAVLDRDLISASRMPQPHRRRVVRDLRAQAAELERLSRRAAELTRRTSAGSGTGRDEAPEVALSRIAERLTLLENAEAELADVERANGLLDAERLIAERPAAAGGRPAAVPHPMGLPPTSPTGIPEMPAPSPADLASQVPPRRARPGTRLPTDRRPGRGPGPRS